MAIKKGSARKKVSVFPAKSRDNRYSIYRLVVIALSLVVCGLLLIISLQYLKQHQAGQALAELEAKIVALSERQAELEEEIVRLQDLDYLETLARERLGLVKPGEVIFQLED
jgi:cell division protein FtsB